MQLASVWRLPSMFKWHNAVFSSFTHPPSFFPTTFPFLVVFFPPYAPIGERRAVAQRLCGDMLNASFVFGHTHADIALIPHF
mmetsp:Transcript_1273/g.3365  ORF Transcript_1273/g.3365 Transcript_1273/m.3365 type:complete len:82 (+) Transcript_1273:1736-1981(+)|eukprot:scaffold163343_cov27-Tisochrysis_lutea.AAC.4